MFEKEAEKYADGIYHYKINVSDYGEDGIINYRYSDVKEAYLSGAEPREREIKSLGERCLQLQKDKGELIDRCRELEAQIEKMKRCEICKHYLWNHCSYEINISEDCIQNKLKHFELKEIKEK